jgi:hypothetical protein
MNDAAKTVRSLPSTHDTGRSQISTAEQQASVLSSDSSPAEVSARLRPVLLQRARRPLVFPRPRVRLLALLLGHCQAHYLSWRNRIRRREIIGFGRLEEACAAFYAGKARLVVTGRHPSLLDGPFTNLALFGGRRGRRRSPYYSYYRGASYFTGALFLSRFIAATGGFAISQPHLSVSEARQMLDILLHGDRPLAVLPEGQPSFVHDRLAGPPPLRFMTFLHKAAAKLARSGQAAEGICVLPVSVEYPIEKLDLRALDRTLTGCENLLGLAGTQHRGSTQALVSRIARLGGRLRAVLDHLYDGSGPVQAETSDLWGTAHWRALIERALIHAERSLKLEPYGDWLQRKAAVLGRCFAAMYGRDSQTDGSAQADQSTQQASEILWRICPVLDFMPGLSSRASSSVDPLLEALDWLDVLQRSVGFLFGRPAPGLLNAGPRRLRLEIREPLWIRGGEADSGPPRVAVETHARLLYERLRPTPGSWRPPR